VYPIRHRSNRRRCRHPPSREVGCTLLQYSWVVQSSDSLFSWYKSNAITRIGDIKTSSMLTFMRETTSRSVNFCEVNRGNKIAQCQCQPPPRANDRTAHTRLIPGERRDQEQERQQKGLDGAPRRYDVSKSPARAL
jgi:hypothetical protein